MKLKVYLGIETHIINYLYLRNNYLYDILLFTYFLNFKENKKTQMMDIKDALLYLDSFDENDMFDFEHTNKLFYVSEVLRFEMYDRIKKIDLNYCEDAILDLIDLTVKIIDMINLKKPGVLQEVKKLYDGVIKYENDSDTECESIEYDDCDKLSEDSDTGEIIGFRSI